LKMQCNPLFPSHDRLSGASLSSNQITLPAGTYYLEASAPAYQVQNHRAFLYNVTDTSVEVLGTTDYIASSNQTRSFVKGRFTIASSKVFELRHFTDQPIASQGLGVSVQDGRVEVYSEIQIWKVA